MIPTISLKIFREIEDIKEDTFEVLNKPPDPVKPSDMKVARKAAFRFFKHPIFFIQKNVITGLFIAAIIIGIQFIPADFVTVANRMYSSVILLLIFFAICLNRYVYWRLNSYLVVPGEGLFIFKAKSLFSLSSENIPFEKIGTIHLKKEGMGSQAYGYGDIVIGSTITNKEGIKIILQQIYKAREVVGKLKVVNEYANN